MILMDRYNTGWDLLILMGRNVTDKPFNTDGTFGYGSGVMILMRRYNNIITSH